MKNMRTEWQKGKSKRQRWGKLKDGKGVGRSWRPFRLLVALLANSSSMNERTLDEKSDFRSG